MSEEIKMTETTSNILDTALADVIIKATQATETATEFLVAEIPDVAYQALLYYGVVAALKCMLGIIFIVIGYKLSVKFHRYCMGESDDLYVQCPPLLGVYPILFTPALMSLNVEWLKIWLAPKLWLIEYAGSLIK